MKKTELISENQAAQMMKIHPSTIMRWRKKGQLEIKYIEKKYLNGKVRIFYERSNIEELIKKIHA